MHFPLKSLHLVKCKVTIQIVSKIFVYQCFEMKKNIYKLINSHGELFIKPGPSTEILSNCTNFTSEHLNCVALEHNVFKTKQLRSLLCRQNFRTWTRLNSVAHGSW